MGRTGGVAPAEVAPLTDRLYLVAQGRYTVLTRKDVESVLKEQNLWATDHVKFDEDLSKKTGRLLAADRLLVGNVGRVGKTYTVHLRIVDVSSGRVLSSAGGDHRGAVDGLLELVERVGVRVLGGGAARPITTKVCLTIECKPGYMFRGFSGIASAYEVCVAGEGDDVGRVVGSGPRGATTANVPAPPPVRLEAQLGPGSYRVWGQIKRKGELYRTEELTVNLTEGGRNYVVLSGVCKRVRQRQ